MNIHLTPENTGGPKCDFCSSPEIVKDYECSDDFTIVAAGLTFGFDKGWAACQECADLIDAGDQVGLAARSTKTFVERNGDVLPPAIINEYITNLHVEFWSRLVR